MWTRIILMAGTVIFALLPLCLTAWSDAIYDGAFLIIAVAFSSDAVSVSRSCQPERQLDDGFCRWFHVDAGACAASIPTHRIRSPAGKNGHPGDGDGDVNP
jgi:hypothetical protein